MTATNEGTIASTSSASPVVVEAASPLGAPIGRIPVANVSPVIEGGAYAAKAVPGERIPVRATVFREGHDAVNASIVTTDPDGNETIFGMHPSTPVGFDWWAGEFTCASEGAWTFRVEGWSDPWATWVRRRPRASLSHPYPAHERMFGSRHFQEAVRKLPVGPDVPHLDQTFILKCLDDMRRLGLIPAPAMTIAAE